MKKILIVIISLLLLSGCQQRNANADADARYLSLVEMVKSHDAFLETPTYFDLTYDVGKIDGGYRYYVILDNPKIAMYDVEMIALQTDAEYSTQIAACLGIFEDTPYSLIPKQSNKEKGFVSGLSMSAISLVPEIELSILIQWKDADLSNQYREYYRVKFAYEEAA